jgi:hypothetical protein
VGCLGFAFAGGGGGAAVGLFSDEGGGGGGPVFRTELVVEDGLALGVKDGVEFLTFLLLTMGNNVLVFVSTT